MVTARQRFLNREKKVEPSTMTWKRLQQRLQSENARCRTPDTKYQFCSGKKKKQHKIHACVWMHGKFFISVRDYTRKMRKGKTAIAIRPLIVTNGAFGARCVACGTLPHQGTNSIRAPCNGSTESQPRDQLGSSDDNSFLKYEYMLALAFKTLKNC